MPQQPVMLGYQFVRIGTTAERVKEDREMLQSFALKTGYHLSKIFVDANPNLPCSAMVDLLRAAKLSCRVVVLGVPRALDLGLELRAQRAMRQLFLRESGKPVLVAEEHQ